MIGAPHLPTICRGRLGAAIVAINTLPLRVCAVIKCKVLSPLLSVQVSQLQEEVAVVNAKQLN